MKNTIWLLFGEHSKLEYAVKVRFKTEAEFEAYMKGVNDACGWMGYYEGRTKAELLENVANRDVCEP
jgi:hypothetical protein